MEKINLNQGWKLHDSPLFWEKDKLEAVRSFQEGWLTCDVPADVRMPLIKEGIIKDPVVADHCLESEWVEKRAWWFFKEFEICGLSGQWSVCRQSEKCALSICLLCRTYAERGEK